MNEKRPNKNRPNPAFSTPVGNSSAFCIGAFCLALWGVLLAQILSRGALNAKSPLPPFLMCIAAIVGNTLWLMVLGEIGPTIHVRPSQPKKIHASSWIWSDILAAFVTIAIGLYAAAVFKGDGKWQTIFFGTSGIIVFNVLVACFNAKKDGDDIPLLGVTVWMTVEALVCVIMAIAFDPLWVIGHQFAITVFRAFFTQLGAETAQDVEDEEG